MGRESSEGIRRLPLSMRALVLGAILLAGLWAWQSLGISPGELVPSRGGRELGARFFAHALRPALDYEAEFVPAGTQPLLLKALQAARRTVVFATAGMSLALVMGFVLGFLASTGWWLDSAQASTSLSGRLWRKLLRPLIYVGSRLLIILMRSVHELLWAVLFLAAFGLTPFSAVIALSIPFGGTLAKVFSELLEEAPRGPARALHAAGAHPLQSFMFGLLPQALPDMSAYTFYRFECAVRSSAILGFFGYETLGYFLKASFENGHYGEVWTYLYVLLALILALEWWSGALRRRFVV